MPKSVAKISALEVNGVNIRDFISVQPTETPLAIQVPLMNDTNFAEVTRRHGVTITYNIPADGFATDVQNVVNGTITVQFDNGARHTYGGVYALNEASGSVEVDSTSALNTVVTYGAESFIKE